MDYKALFEVCAFNIQSAIIAEKAGAGRVELCDNPIEGGTTPSYGSLLQTRNKINIPLYPLIRPRAGNYFYDDEEFEIIIADIKICKEIGCDGISIGVQKLNGLIDTERFKKIVDLAYPMGVTCNRVFDACPNPFEALETIIDSGCERILTSGQMTAAADAPNLLQKLVVQAGNRIIIMPGAGINSNNIAALKLNTGAKEFHGSAKKTMVNPMTYLNILVSDYGNVFFADEDEIRKIVHLL